MKFNSASRFMRRATVANPVCLRWLMALEAKVAEAEFNATANFVSNRNRRVWFDGIL